MLKLWFIIKRLFSGNSLSNASIACLLFTSFYVGSGHGFLPGSACLIAFTLDGRQCVGDWSFTLLWWSVSAAAHDPCQFFSHKSITWSPSPTIPIGSFGIHASRLRPPIDRSGRKCIVVSSVCGGLRAQAFVLAVWAKALGVWPSGGVGWKGFTGFLEIS